MSCGKCREVTTDSKIKVQEGGRSAVVRNKDREAYHRIRVDRCLVTNSLAADFVITKDDGSVVIELKGIDVEHAVGQVSATVELLRTCEGGVRKGRAAGLVVCSRYPRIDTRLQRLKKQFAKNHKAPLHVVARNSEFDFERILSFDGPL